MFYEVKTIGINEEGKEVKEQWLVMDDNILGAIHKACEEAVTTDVESAKVSPIYEVINEDMHMLEARYIVEFACPTKDEKGKEKELKYKVFVYASNFDDAKARCIDHLKQGYDGFKISGLNESKIVKYIK